MARLTVELNNNKTTYRPGELIEGVVGWELDSAPKWVEVRLYWHTAGKGDEDVRVVEAMRIEEPATVDAQVFGFSAPDGPFSYRGTLIELMWGVEVVAHRTKQTALVDLSLSATGEPVVS